MTEAEIQALQTVLADFRKENTEAHTEIFNLIRGLASRQDKMNGGLATVKWIIAVALTVTIPLVGALLAHSL